MAGIHGQRGEDWENIALEEFASPGDLGFVQLLNGPKVDSLLG